MGCAESIVDINIGKVRQLPGELRIVFCFAFVKAKVLKNNDFAIFELINHGLNFRADTIGRKFDIQDQKLAQSFCRWRQ